MHIHFLGLMPYEAALRTMEEFHALVCADPQHPGVLLVVQHPPVVTMGNREQYHDMLVSPESLAKDGIDFAKIDRGGSVTVHEPGQVVVYPIVRLQAKGFTVRQMVWCLEEAMIRLCASHGVTAARDEINPGVWVGQNKIGALGVRVHNRVSKHGLALNINNSLETFRRIVPCGLAARGVTSLRNELMKQHRDAALDLQKIEVELARYVAELFATSASPS